MYEKVRDKTSHLLKITAFSPYYNDFIQIKKMFRDLAIAAHLQCIKYDLDKFQRLITVY